MGVFRFEISVLFDSFEMGRDTETVEQAWRSLENNIKWASDGMWGGVLLASKI